jgi:hypothetical protein
MQDNNNSLINGDTSPPDRFANIRAAEERKLLARNNGHGSKKIIMEQVTNIPIPEDENEDADNKSGRDSGGTASTPVDADNTDSALLKSTDSKLSRPHQALEAVYARYEISKKSRIPFLVLSIVSVVLFLIVLILAIVWPYIPSYMRADVCIDPECFDASKQVSNYSSLDARGRQTLESPSGSGIEVLCSLFMARHFALARRKNINKQFVAQRRATGDVSTSICLCSTHVLLPARRTINALDSLRVSASSAVLEDEDENQTKSTRKKPKPGGRFFF